MSFKRLFLAVFPPDEICVQIYRKFYLAHNKTTCTPSVVPKKNYHITLHYFGSVAGQVFDDIASSVRIVSSKSLPFVCRMHGLHTFEHHSGKTPIWLGVDRGAKKLQDYISSLHELLHYPIKADFVPHLTLGRSAVAPHEEMFNVFKNFQSNPFDVHEVCLVDSKITETGADYSVIQKFQLGENCD